MNHTFGRRATTTAATLAVAAATLLAVGGTASATSDPSVDRTADASHSSSSITVQHGDNRGGDRDRDRESSNRRIDRDSSDLYVYDSHRRWERNDNKWHHNNGGQRHSYDGQQFHRWNADKWVTVSAKAHGLNDHTSR